MSEIDAVTGAVKPAAAPKPAKAAAAQAKAPVARPDPPNADPLVCPHCNARFDRPLKFCGECGKPMQEVKVS